MSRSPKVHILASSRQIIGDETAVEAAAAAIEGPVQAELIEFLRIEGWDSSVDWAEAHDQLFEGANKDIYFFSKEAVPL